MSIAIAEAPTLRRKPVEPGIYRGVPFDEYYSWDALNFSTLKRFSKTPAHVYHSLITGEDDDETQATKLGWLLHLATLETSQFDELVVVAPAASKKSKIGKAIRADFEAKNEGKYCIEEKELGAVKSMARALQRHPKSGEFLRGQGESELCVVWDDPATGVRCKARIDRIAKLEEWPVVVAGDFKSAKDASEHAWQSAVVRYHYDVQASHYLAGLEAHYPIPAGAVAYRRFVHFVVENVPPYCVAAYELDDQALENAAAKRRRYLRQWKECQETGLWTGYPDEIQNVTLPRWALTDSGSEE